MNRNRLITILSAFIFLAGLSFGQASAAPMSAGVNPPLPEQAVPVITQTFSSGLYHTCAIKTDGTLACWGAGTAGASGLDNHGRPTRQAALSPKSAQAGITPVVCTPTARPPAGETAAGVSSTASTAA